MPWYEWEVPQYCPFNFQFECINAIMPANLIVMHTKVFKWPPLYFRIFTEEVLLN